MNNDPSTKQDFDKIKEKLDFTVPKSLKFVMGTGDPAAQHTACIMSATAFMLHKASGTEEQFITTDLLSCVDDSITTVCIEINDKLKSSSRRKSWALKYIPKILGTAFVPKEIKKERSKLVESIYTLDGGNATTIKKMMIILDEMIELGKPVIDEEEIEQAIEQTVCRI